MVKYSTPVQCLHYAMKCITKKIRGFFPFCNAFLRINKLSLSFLSMAIIITHHKAELLICLCTSYDCEFSERSLIMYLL